MRTKQSGILAAVAAVGLLVPGAPVHLSANAGGARAGQVARTSDDQSLQRLLAMAADEHPEIRLQAIAALGNTPGLSDEPAIKRAAALALFAALDDPHPPIRLAALLSLVNIGGWDYDPGHGQRIARVSRELAVWAAEREADAAIQRSVGIAHLLAGEPDLAAQALEVSLDVDPGGESTRYLLGLARMRQKRAADAAVLFRQVPPSDPYYPNAVEQLKQIP